MLSRFFTTPRRALFGAMFVLALSIVAAAADPPLIDGKGEPSPKPSERKAEPPAAESVADAKKPDQIVYATLLVSAVRPRIMPSADDKFDRAEFAAYKQSQAALLKSDAVAQKALDDKSMRELPMIKEHGIDAAQWLADQLVVDAAGNSGVIRVGFAAADRAAACHIVNAIVNAYMSEVVERERTEMLAKRDILDKKYLLYKNRLLQTRQDLFRLEMQIGGQRDSEAHEAWMRGEIADLEKQAAEMRRTRTQAKLQVARARQTLESLNDSSPDYKAATAAVRKAELEEKFWTDELAALPSEFAKLQENLLKSLRYDGDADLLRADTEALSGVVQEMDKALERMNIDLDADARVQRGTPAA